MRRLRISVSRRLAGLVVAEVVTAGVLVAVATADLAHLRREAAFVSRYVVPPVEVIAFALLDTAALTAAVSAGDEGVARIPVTELERLLAPLQRFEAEYGAEWHTSAQGGPDARRFVRQLQSHGDAALLREEHAAVVAVGGALARLSAAADAAKPGTALVAPRDVEGLRGALRRLFAVKLRYLSIAQTHVIEKTRRLRDSMLAIGLAGVALAGLAALRVRAAVAPRIERLVGKVRRFREIGVHERIFEEGDDEIAVLANALDAGFAAITARDRERERFLAILAHELKTPLMSILGFSEAALGRRDDAGLRERALEVIHRHAARLDRLVEDVLLAARARVGDVPFHPAATDLVAALRRAAAEVEAMAPGRAIRLDLPESAVVLGDRELLNHAFWTLLTYAMIISARGEPVRVHITQGPARQSVDVEVRGPEVPREEIDRALAPLGTLVYEGGVGVRVGVGLYLSREIARLHGGALRVSVQAGMGTRLTVELPC